MKHIKLVFLLLSAGLVQGCGSADENSSSRIGIQFPSKLSAQAIVQKSARVFAAPGENHIEDIWSSDFDPENREDLNCFGVVVGGPSGESDFQANSCFENETGNEFNFGPRKIGALAGEFIELEVSAGQQRQIKILAWRAESKEACQTLGTETDVDVDKLSHPFVIASLATDLEPGDNAININASFNSAKKLVGCDNFKRGEKFQQVPNQPLSFTVEGLALEETVVLQNNGGDDVEVTANGEFAFPTPLFLGDEFKVTVAQHPDTQVCVVENGSGEIGVSGETIKVFCDEGFLLGGSVEGLFGRVEQPLILMLNGTEFIDDIHDAPEGDNTGNFNTIFHPGDTYSVEIVQQPSLHECQISNGEGVFTDSSIFDVQIVCQRFGFSVGGTVSGLEENETVTIVRLREPEGSRVSFAASFDTEIPEDLPSCAELFFGLSDSFQESQEGLGNCTIDKDLDAVEVGNGPFQMPSLQADGTGYFVFVPESGVSSFGGAPFGKECFVQNDFNSIAGADVDDIEIVCQKIQATVQVTASGVSENDAVVTLRLNGDDTNEITFDASNGSFGFFPQTIDFGTDYEVTIESQSEQVVCSLSANAEGKVDSSIVEIELNCIPNSFSVGGTLSGLGNGRTLSIDFGNDTQSVSITASGDFSSGPVFANGESFEVTISSQPSGQTCQIVSGTTSGEIQAADVNDLVIICDVVTGPPS